ncbi:hypothetical protein Pjdr2_5073 [Paenibacillus sp. JDR-2]|nr:hypothetical protein Pjdr2_5073 [Paenibacillus sp. JDR-2]
MILEKRSVRFSKGITTLEYCSEGIPEQGDRKNIECAVCNLTYGLFHSFIENNQKSKDYILRTSHPHLLQYRYNISEKQVRKVE